ncbi:hypothetical protein ACTFIW_000606 [Dictyostelium discoideum]
MASVSSSSSRLSVSTPRKLDEWTNVTKTGIVLFPFNATHKFQLPLSVGDFVQIHAQTSQEQIGWYSGVSVTTQESGIFPQSFVVILPEQTDIDDPLSLPNHIPICSKLNLTNDEMSNSSIVNEITSTIVEWATLLKIYSTGKQYNEFKVLSQKISQLVQYRNQILLYKSPKEITYDLRDRILSIIDEGRRDTGMTIVLRKEIPNTYSSLACQQASQRTSINIPPTVATDLILADAENSGVFTLCTMYQEKKLEIVALNNSFRDSFEYDSLEISGANLNNSLNNVNSNNNNNINNSNIAAAGGLQSSLSTNNLLNGANVILSQSPSPMNSSSTATSLSQQQSPNSSSIGQSPISSGQSSPTNSSSTTLPGSSPSNGNNILGSSMNGGGIGGANGNGSPLSNSNKDLQFSSSQSQSSILQQTQSQSQLIQQQQQQQQSQQQSQQQVQYSSSPSSQSSSSFSSSPGNSSFLSSKLNKQGSSKNFLSNVLLKSKGSSSSTSSLSMSGGMLPPSNGSPNGLNSSGGFSNHGNGLSNSNNGVQPSSSSSSPSSSSPSSSSMVSSSYVSVSAQSPSSISSPNVNGGLNQSLSSLNLNSPILSNSPNKKMQTIKMKSRQYLLQQQQIQQQQQQLQQQQQQGGNSNSNGGNNNNNNGEMITKFNSQLLISLNNFLYSSGDNIDIVLSIYNRSENKFLSESYCGIVPPHGIFVEPENPNERIRTIFRDLELKDLNSDLYLVAKLYRKTNSLSSKDPNSSPTLTRSNANMSSSSNLNNLGGPTKLFRKFVGCGVKRLDLLNEGVSELMITLNTTSSENNFYNLHEQIINEQTTIYEPITRAKGVVFTVQLFTGDYQQFLQEFPDFRSVTTSLKLQLPEVVLPGGERNDMYIQLEEGDFSDKNIEVQLQVRTESGQIIHDAIKFANGQSSTSEFKTPLIPSALCKWNEIVKIWVTAKTFEKSHLFFLFRQCSEKKDKERQTIGFGYLKFMSDEGSIIKDQQYTINVYKSNTDDVPVSSYINGGGVVDNEKSSKSTKKLDSIKVRTTFVSNCLTQNPSVVNLSRWQQYGGDLSSLIKDITFLNSQDLVRNLQEIFYNFLSILDQQLNDSPLSMEIFRAIVFIIGVLVESRTSNYRPALDLYASKYFGTPLSSSNNKQDSFTGITAHTHLLRSVVKNLENFEIPANASKISSSLKALEYIFKLVVASKTKFTANKMDTLGGSNNESYQTNLKSVVDILCEIMLSGSPSLIGAKTIALKNFESMFTDLKKFFTVEEMGIIALKFMKSIQHDEKKKTFSILKLKLLSSYINGPMMLCKETRKQLLPLVFQLLHFHFSKSSEETDMCLMILGLIVDIMITKSELRGKDKDPWLMEMLHFFVPILELLQLLNNGNNINSLTTTSNNTTTTTTTTTTTNNTTTTTTTTTSTTNSTVDEKRKSLSSITSQLSIMISTMNEENQNNLRIKIYAFILGTARLSGVQHWEMVNKSVTQLNKNFFINLYDSLQLIFESPKFPSDFWTFTVFQLKTILRMTRILEDVIFYLPSNVVPAATATLINNNNSNSNNSITITNNNDIGSSANTGGSGNSLINQSQFEFTQWRSFFLLTSSYLNCKDLQFESVNPAKAVFIKTRCGDVRIEMARVFERVWATVPIKERSTFIPVLIGPIVKLSISDTMDAKRVATKIFYDMLESEIIQTNGYTDLFYHTIDSLLEISTERLNRKGWPIVCRSVDGKLPFTLRSFSTFFNVKCMSLVLNKSTDAIKTKSEQFIHDINHFLYLITSFMNDVKSGDEEEIFSSVSKLLYYLQEHKRTAQFIRFVHMTSRRHYEMGNYIEAAVTLMLHASLYQWDANKVIAQTASEYGSFPEQKESERKELLYKEILLCFNNGKAWDRAIPLVKELVHHFTMNICDMNSAATYLRQQGAFYQKINESADPVFEDYFRVGYYGKGFPSSIQNKEFIYKGNQFDRLSDFISKIQDKWPKSELLKTTEVPSQQIQDSDGQYLLITSVNISNIGETQKRHDGANAESITNKKRVPHRVQQFNARNKVNVFVYSKPFKKNATATKSQNEFEDLWVMNLYFVCENSFPCTERRCLIVERKQVEISPIENALNSIVQKNDELAARIDRHQANTQESISPLTMLLNGIIDASVNGGVSRYETFMSEDYLKQNPEYKNIAELLKSALDQQLVIVEQGLKLHSQLRPPEMAAMQDKLETFFITMKNSRQKLN